MLRSILLAYEPAMVSLAAADLAEHWAARLQASVHVLGVLDETIVATTAVPLGGLEYKHARDQDLLERDRQAVQAGLDAIQFRLEEARVATRVITRSGTPHQVVLEEAQSCDLIVLGNEAESDTGIGEPPSQILWEVLRAAPRPVVAVPDHHRTGSGVLIAYDGRPPSARALYAFQASGLERLGAVHVLSIDPHSTAAATERTYRAIDYLALHKISATPHPTVTQADEPETILAEAERLGVGLIAMGCLGRGTLREFVAGSTTTSMLRHSTYPLFLFR
jgi:nucleotide-binding universal stress UspA family protein